MRAMEQGSQIAEMKQINVRCYFVYCENTKPGELQEIVKSPVLGHLFKKYKFILRAPPKPFEVIVNKLIFGVFLP